MWCWLGGALTLGLFWIPVFYFICRWVDGPEPTDTVPEMVREVFRRYKKLDVDIQ